jgi:hypothetical protein
MTGAQSMTGIPMKIFIEQKKVLIPGLLIEPVVLSMQGPPPRRIPSKQADHPFRQVVRYLLQCLSLPRARRVLYRQSVAIKLSVLPDGLDDQVVDRYPDRPAPVGIAAEEVGSRVARIIFDMIIDTRLC